MDGRLMVPLLEVEHRWQCPSCGAQQVTTDHRPHTPMHDCPSQHGLSVPYVEVHGSELAKHSTRHVLVEREDLIGDETGVTLDDTGRAVMAVRTERADGSNDVAVYAPTAIATVT
jgi:hypothetical protein